MISERQFARNYASFWRDLMPMGEKYIRHINLTPERYDYDDVKSTSSADRRGLINETAFLFFSDLIRLDKTLCEFDNIPMKDIRLSEKIAKNKIALIEKKDIKSYKKLNLSEIKEVYSLSASIFKYIDLWPENKSVMVSPKFDGCGLLESCYGDLLVNNTLCEVKSGDRKFRSVDLRQVLIYVALNVSCKKHTIKEISLVNPRHYLYYDVDIEEACFAVSGLDFNECVNQIINFLSGIGMSK